jgi:hypothetical protein
MDAPADEAAAARVPLDRRASLHRTPLVLQVSPLPRTSDQNKFSYGPFTDIKSGDFAAAHAFFIHHGHTIVYHKCPNAIAFQELFPLATIGYISCLLEAQRELLRTSQRAAPTNSPPPATPPCSMLDHYMTAGFGNAQNGPPSWDGPPSALATKSSSTATASRVPPQDSSHLSSHRPDPDGYDNSTLVHYGGLVRLMGDLLLWGVRWTFRFTVWLLW